MILGGFLEFVLGNTFPFLVFTSFGKLRWYRINPSAIGDLYLMRSFFWHP